VDNVSEHTPELSSNTMETYFVNENTDMPVMFPQESLKNKTQTSPKSANKQSKYFDIS